MKKSYTVTWEDGKPASVEVNGVRYSDPLLIPDRRDRAAIKRLLSRRAGRQSDLVDDAEMDAEMQDLHRGTERMMRVVVGIFLGVALLMLAIAAVAGVYTARALAREVTAPAWVSDVVPRLGEDGMTYYYPVANFTAQDGRDYSVLLPDGSTSPAYRTGQEIVVRYDPARPETARVDALGGTLERWLVTMITGFIGAVFLIVSLGVAWLMRAEARGQPAD